jgi:hypothetical protein
MEDVTVARCRDGSLGVPARVVTSDGKVGDGVTRIRRGHPEYEAWRSYCERHPEDVVERGDQRGPLPEPLEAGLGLGVLGTALGFVWGAAEGFDGMERGDVVAGGVGLFIGWFAVGFIGVSWSKKSDKGNVSCRCRVAPGREVSRAAHSAERPDLPYVAGRSDECGAAALLGANSFVDLPGKWQAAIFMAEENRPMLRLVSDP